MKRPDFRAGGLPIVLAVASNEAVARVLEARSGGPRPLSLLTSGERRKVERGASVQRFAVRILAKRAFFYLARRAGYRHPMKWSAFEIVQCRSGAPRLLARDGKLLAFLRSRRLRPQVSLTHTRNYSMAAAAFF